MESMRAEGEIIQFPTEDVGGRARFDDFFREEHERLFKSLYFVTGSRADAEELMQDAFLRLWERWDRIDTIDDPTGYLFRVSMNLFRSRYRRASLAVRRMFSLAPDATDDLAAVETRDEVVRLLRGLEPRQRAAVLLTSMLDYSAAEAGQMLGLRASSIRSLTTRARARMRHEVGDSA